MQIKLSAENEECLAQLAHDNNRSTTAEGNVAIRFYLEHTWQEVFDFYNKKNRLSPAGNKNQRVPRKQK